MGRKPAVDARWRGCQGGRRRPRARRRARYSRLRSRGPGGDPLVIGGAAGSAAVRDNLVVVLLSQRRQANVKPPQYSPPGGQQRAEPSG